MVKRTATMRLCKRNYEKKKTSGLFLIQFTFLQKFSLHNRKTDKVHYPTVSKTCRPNTSIVNQSKSLRLTDRKVVVDSKKNQKSDEKPKKKTKKKKFSFINTHLS